MTALEWTATAAGTVAGATIVATAGVLLASVAPMYFFAWLAASVVTP